MWQVTPRTPWPSGGGWTVAILSLSPRELSERYGVRFLLGVDDLDEFCVAALKDRLLGQIWLFRHEHAPFPGTRVDVDRSVSRDEDLSALNRQLRLGAEEFNWITEETNAPRVSGVA
jgi:hypothetical protein